MLYRMTSLRVISAIFATNVFLGSALAAETRPFDAGQFAKDQEAGKPIVIDAAADWCPTCKAQNVIINALAEDRSSNPP